MSGTANGPYKDLEIVDVTNTGEGPQVVRVLNSGDYRHLAAAALDIKANPPEGINLPIQALIDTGFPSTNTGGTSGAGFIMAHGPQGLALVLQVDGPAARDSLVATLRSRGVRDARPAATKG